MNIPRRSQTQEWCEAERKIYDSMQVVEAMGADVRLTDAVVLLGAARDRVADFVDGVEGKRTIPSRVEPAPREREALTLKALAEAVRRAADYWVDHFGTRPAGTFIGEMPTEEFIRAARQVAAAALGGEPHGLPGEPGEAPDYDTETERARRGYDDPPAPRVRASGAATHGERDALAHVASEIEGQLKHGELSSAPWGTRMYWSQIVAVARAALAASPAPESPFRDVVHALVWAADHDMFSRQTIRDLGTILESARDALNRATSEAPRGEK